MDLKAQGFDLDKIGGELVYFLSQKSKSFVVLTHETQRLIEDGSIRLWCYSADDGCPLVD